MLRTSRLMQQWGDWYNRLSQERPNPVAQDWGREAVRHDLGEGFITFPSINRSGGVGKSPPSSFSDTSRLRFSEGQNRKCCLHCTGGWRNTLKHSRWLFLLFGWEWQYLSCNTARNKPQLQPLAELVVSDWFYGSSLWIQRIYPLQIRDPGKWQQRCQII